ncbi:MAG: class I SAM-dependent methyltransferase [Gemmatimonadaceae bacterium]|nr:class I SAM-dependent methyltransferase [Gemmatimonadaceae bacterium]
MELLDIKGSYDSAADAYADHLFLELEHKPLDRHILDRFAESVRGRGLVADLGCGPGHIAKYLYEQSVTVVGIDLSPEMVRCAMRLCPGLEFRVGDMQSLDLPAEGLAGIVAFYSIVHFDASELPAIFRECRRVLLPKGLMLLAFHIGDQEVHVDDLFGRPVDLDFRFHQPGNVIRALRAEGFVVTESAEREPYEAVEYPSRRCYLLATAV